MSLLNYLIYPLFNFWKNEYLNYLIGYLFNKQLHFYTLFKNLSNKQMFLKFGRGLSEGEASHKYCKTIKWEHKFQN